VGDRRFIHQHNIDDAVDLLSKVIEVLNRFEIQYYLDFGTLIGAIRDNGLIPWDDDIDISLLHEEDYEKMPQVLKEIRKKHNLRTYLFTFQQSLKKRKEQGKKTYVNKISFTKDTNYQIAKIRTNRFWIFGRGNSNMDIFFKYTHENASCWLAYGKENRIPLEYSINELIEIDFYGLKCTIPKDYDRYLTYKYGDWRTPKEHWTHANDDYSIIEHSTKK
jgi:phosphorylcholine metabolism protein LicD